MENNTEAFDIVIRRPLHIRILKFMAALVFLILTVVFCYHDITAAVITAALSIISIITYLSAHEEMYLVSTTGITHISLLRKKITCSFSAIKHIKVEKYNNGYVCDVYTIGNNKSTIKLSLLCQNVPMLMHSDAFLQKLADQDEFLRIVNLYHSLKG